MRDVVVAGEERQTFAAPVDAGHRRDVEVHAPYRLRADPERPDDRGLDRRHVAHRDDGAFGTQPLGAELADPRAHRREALATGRRERRVVAPLPPFVRAHVAELATVPLAVVELEESVVGFDRDAEHRRDLARGIGGAHQRARQHRGRAAVRETGRHEPRLLPSELGERRVEPALEATVAVDRGLPVAHEDDHVPTSARRPRRRSSRRRAGSRSPKRVQIHTVAATPRSSSITTTGTAGSSATWPKLRPNPGHQNTRCDANAPESASPQNHPIGRPIQRRRSSRRPRPLVTSMTSPSARGRREQRVPVGLVTEGKVDEERQQRADGNGPEVEARALEDVPDREHRTGRVPEQHEPVSRSRRRHEDGAAVVAGRDTGLGVVADPVDLGRGDREPASLARVADEERDTRAVILRAAAFEVGEQLGPDGGRLFGAGRLLDRDLGVELGFGCGERGLERTELGRNPASSASSAVSSVSSVSRRSITSSSCSSITARCRSSWSMSACMSSSSRGDEIVPEYSLPSTSFARRASAWASSSSRRSSTSVSSRSRRVASARVATCASSARRSRDRLALGKGAAPVPEPVEPGVAFLHAQQGREVGTGHGPPGLVGSSGRRPDFFFVVVVGFGFFFGLVVVVVGIVVVVVGGGGPVPRPVMLM